MIAAAVPASAPPLPWLLAGARPEAGAEPLDAHLERLGPLPDGGPELIEAVAASGLRGRGGARFPTARKWEAVAARARRRAVLLVNGAEGEPASWTGIRTARSGW